MEKKEGAGPTRNLFPTCQDDSTRAVGAHPWMITWTWSDPRGADKKSPMYLEPWSPSTTPFLSSFFRLLFVYNPLFRIVRTRRNDARGGACTKFATPPTHLPWGSNADRYVAPSGRKRAGQSCLSRPRTGNNRSVYFNGHANRRLLILHRYAPLPLG